MALGDFGRGWRAPLLRHFVTEGYIYDWLLALALIIVNFTVPGPVVKALQRHYTEGDPALSYPSVHVALSESQKFYIEFLVPGLIALIWQLLRRGASLGDKLLDWHHLMLSVLEAFAVECSFKKWMNLVGRLRPDWFARLSTHDPQTIEDGRTSYPSGHAAEMFAVFTVTSLYLCAKARLFTSAGPGHFAKAVLCLLPLGLATFITMSRVAGYKHDFSDVNCGMALGLASGAFAYHLNYPSPFDPSCDEPRTRGGAAARRGKTAALAAEATDTAAAAAPAGESLEEGGGGALHDPLLG